MIKIQVNYGHKRQKTRYSKHITTYMYTRCWKFCIVYILMGAGIAQSEWLATGWTVRGSNPSRGARFFAHVQTGPGAHPASCTMGTGSFPGVKRPGRGADHPPPSSAEVKKEHSYTSIPPLGLRVCYGVLLPSPFLPFTFTFFALYLYLFCPLP
jgi:hypothetical protein